MTKLHTCRYNMDTNRVEARFADGTILAIEYGNTPAQQRGDGALPIAGLRPRQAGRLSLRKRAAKSLIARRAFLSVNSAQIKLSA